MLISAIRTQLYQIMPFPSLPRNSRHSVEREESSTSLEPRTTQPPMGRPPHWSPVPPSHQWGVHLTGAPYHPATNGASTSLEPRTTQPPMGRPPHWCPVPPSHQWGIHLTGAPYHPATNGASTSLVPRTTQPPMGPPNGWCRLSSRLSLSPRFLHEQLFRSS